MRSLFDIISTRERNSSKFLPLGATLVSGICWAAGTASGIVAGDVLPSNVVASLSVALYGMFLAIIIPPARKDRAIGIAVVVSFVLSGICSVAPVLSSMSTGTRTILLTILISVAAAILHPVNDVSDGQV